jgi:hypothetical protein
VIGQARRRQCSSVTTWAHPAALSSDRPQGPETAVDLTPGTRSPQCAIGVSRATCTGRLRERAARMCIQLGWMQAWCRICGAILCYPLVGKPVGRRGEPCALNPEGEPLTGEVHHEDRAASLHRAHVAHPRCWSTSCRLFSPSPGEHYPQTQAELSPHPDIDLFGGQTVTGKPRTSWKAGVLLPAASAARGVRGRVSGIVDVSARTIWHDGPRSPRTRGGGSTESVAPLSTRRLGGEHPERPGLCRGLRKLHDGAASRRFGVWT